MANQTDHAAWPKAWLFTGAGIFVLLYALAAAWIVAADADGPAPLEVTRTVDGEGLVIAGAVADADDRAAMIAAIGTVSDATVIITELVIDDDAPPIPDPLDAADDLVSALPPREE